MTNINNVKFIHTSHYTHPFIYIFQMLPSSIGFLTVRN